jgi:hypothetical protein
MKSAVTAALAMLALCGSTRVMADTADAACVIYPRGEDHSDVTIPCSFSQRQGHITLRRSDGVEHDLSPVGDRPGNFTDQDGNAAFRQSGLGDQGVIFRFPQESVYVYWNTAMLEPQEDSSSPTWPFTTSDYDATTLLPCRAPGETEFGNCPAGIMRMENAQASIVVQNAAGEQFTINFMTGYVNATNREVKASLEGDIWTLRFGNGEVWRVPLSAIEGG